MQRPVEADLTDHMQTADGLRRNPLGCHQHADRNGKVETRPRLAMVRWCEVDRDPPIGPVEPARKNGGPHSITGFTTCLIGQAKHGETRQAGANVHLNGDRMPMCTSDRGRCDIRNHVRTPYEEFGQVTPSHNRGGR